MSTGDSGLDDLITRVKASGGSEIANTQPVAAAEILGSAREVGANDSKEAFDAALERVASGKV